MRPMVTTARRMLLVASLIALATLYRCMQNISGGGTEDGNATKICGMVTDSEGKPAPGTRLTLLSWEHNPALDQFGSTTYETTADSSGSYVFSLDTLAAKVYNIEARHETSRKKALFTGIKTGETDTVFVPLFALAATGTVKLFLPDTLDTADGYLFVQGTSIYKNLSEAKQSPDGDFVLYLDDCPAAVLPSIVRGSETDPLKQTTLSQGVQVLPGDTAIAGVFFSWQKYTVKNSPLPSNSVTDVFIDRNGNKWFGTIHGIAMLEDTVWTVYSTATTAGLPDNYINCIAADSSGGIWVGTYHGAGKFDGSSWTAYTPENSGIMLYGVYCIECDRNGTVWFSGPDYGITCYDNGSWRNFHTSNSGLISNLVEDIVVDKNNHLWCATGKGVAKYDGVAWTAWKPDGLPTVCGRILLDRRERVWVDDPNSAVMAFDAGEWQVYPDSASWILTNGNVWKLFEDRNGDIWVGTHVGLTIFDGTSWSDCSGEKYSLIDGLGVHDIEIDTDGRKWLATDGGGAVLVTDGHFSYAPQREIGNRFRHDRPLDHADEAQGVRPPGPYGLRAIPASGSGRGGTRTAAGRVDRPGDEFAVVRLFDQDRVAHSRTFVLGVE